MERPSSPRRNYHDDRRRGSGGSDHRRERDGDRRDRDFDRGGRGGRGGGGGGGGGGRDDYRRRDTDDRRDSRPRDSRRRDSERREYHDRDDRRREQERKDPARDVRRRSASPRSRPRSPAREGRSRSKSRSKSPEDKAKPNFGASGLLAADTKTVKAADGTKTVLKYHEPPEARKPLIGWRLYVFKGAEQVDLLHIQRQSAYLIGRDKTVVDIPLDHPSCSKQHAVIQHRHVQERNEFGEVKGVIKPFIIDLESTNGTSVNDSTIPTSRYYELQVNDVIKFGDSVREYVLLHDDAS